MKPGNLDFLLSSFERLDNMRNLWKEAGHYEKIDLEKNAKEYKKRLNSIKGQYKRYLKEKYYYDDFYCEVVDSVF